MPEYGKILNNILININIKSVYLVKDLYNENIGNKNFHFKYGTHTKNMH